MTMLGRFFLRLRRAGPRALVETLRQALRPEILVVYRWESGADITAIPGVQIHRGVDALRRLRGGCRLLPEDFYHDGRRGFTECLTATVNGRLAGVVWILSGAPARRYLRLAQNQLKPGYLHVLPPYRGMGLAKLLYWHAAITSLELGSQEVLAVISQDNMPARKSAEAAGFRPVGSLVRRYLWGPRLPVPPPPTNLRPFEHGS